MILTKNHCIDVYRKNKKEKEFKNSFEDFLFKIPSEANVEKEAIFKEKYLKILEFLHELPEETASMVLMKDLLGLSLEELSEIFRMPVGTIKSKLSRARLQIAEKLREFFDKEKKSEKL